MRSREHGPRFNARWAAVISFAAFLLATVTGAGGLRFIFGALTLVLATYLAWRGLSLWRQRLLWSLRNRVLAAYALVGLIPIVLLLLVGLVAGWTVYGKVAVYLVTDELQLLQTQLQDVASDVATSLEVAAALEGRLRPQVVNRIIRTRTDSAREQLAGVEIRLVEGSASASSDVPAWLRGQRFAGILLSEQAELCVTLPVSVASESLTVVLLLPLDERVLPYLGRETGRVLLQVLGEPNNPSNTPGQRRFMVGTTSYPVVRVVQDLRPLPPPYGWWDTTLSLVSSQATHWKESGRAGPPLVLIGEARLAQVHRQLSYRLGEFSGVPFTVFTAFAILFFLLELVALRAGIRLTRAITSAVNDLQVATEQVQTGNFSHRIRLRGRDQLSGLAQAFNSMTASIERLIAESTERQRLQDELEVARQVQEQLFPRETPDLESLELFAQCLPARVVSGDYYDYGVLDAGRLVFAIGDISGKGISAALLMATIQAALRSHVTAARLEGNAGKLSTATLVSRLNRQLYLTTSNEKYASLFCAFYNEAERTLTYTNAGHIAPVVLRDGRFEKLEVGGAVVGLFGDARYEEAHVRLDPGTVLVAFTDGFTEAENAYGEELTQERLLRAIQAHAQDVPAHLARALVDEVRHWTSADEQMDDMTLLIARAR